MGDERRVYSDEEFALILRRAAELAETADSTSHAQGGLTLAEMKAAAAQVGIDPTLVERAARLQTSSDSTRASSAERWIGGPVRHGAEAHFPVVLDQAGAAELLSAIRIGVGRPGDGFSSAQGLTWRSPDDWGSVLSLSARTDSRGTSITADLDRRGTLVVGASLTAFAAFAATVFGATVAGGVAPGFEPAGALFGLAGVLTVARGYWRSSTRTARQRLGRVLDSVGRFLTQEGGAESGGARAASGPEDNPGGEASPVRPIRELRGIRGGVDVPFEREPDREL